MRTLHVGTKDLRQGDIIRFSGKSHHEGLVVEYTASYTPDYMLVKLSGLDDEALMPVRRTIIIDRI